MMHATHAETTFEAVVADKTPAADGVCLLTLRHAEGRPLPAWSPGSHVDLHLGDGLVRQYSLCGDLADEFNWQVAVLLEPMSRGGSASVHHRVGPGDRLTVRGPRNNFQLVDAPAYSFVAGGIGVTPLLPMIQRVHALGREWQLAYGGRLRGSMAFRDELVQRYGDRVRLLPEDEVGRIPLTEVLGGATESTAIYCCGPEPLIAAAESEHRRLGIGALHVERFAPREQPPAPTGHVFTVEARRSGKSVTVGAETSILEALLEAGVPVDSSCTEGICGTCETPVLDGDPDHRDSILTDDERTSGDTMFVCVSRCHSETLVLDI